MEKTIVQNFRAVEAGRLDRVVAAQLADLSRAKVQDLIRRGRVRVNGQPVTKPGAAVAPSDRIRVARVPASSPGLQPVPIPLDILFESDEILVINKPAGMMVHPGAGTRGTTLVQAALAHAPELKSVGEEGRPGIVHRLDRDTSGVIVLAKTEAALRTLQQQFKRRQVEKVYLALVDGVPPSPSGQIEAPLSRAGQPRKRIGVNGGVRSRSATSIFRVREAFRDHSLLELRPITGRTHQIRVHLQFLGCPVVGDRLYGRHRPTLPVKRQMLHAWRLTLRPPGAQAERTFKSEPPPDFQEAVRAARQR
jgi:23S rRNA pseudouridine1911/1915/1917 synthase